MKEPLRRRTRLTILGAAFASFLAAVVGLGFYNHPARSAAANPAPALNSVPGAQVLSVLTGSEYVQNWGATVSQVFSTLLQSSFDRDQELVYNLGTPVGNTVATTAEYTLASFTISSATASPAMAVGTGFRMTASFSGSSTGNTKTFHCYVGSVEITSPAGTVNPAGTCDVRLNAWSTATSASWLTMSYATGSIAPIADSTDTVDSINGSGITFKVTVTDGTSATQDATLNAMWIERLGN